MGEPGVGKSRLVLGVHPLPSHPGVARARGGLGLLRQGHLVPARDRPPQGLFPDRGPRRRAAASARRSTGKLLTLDRALDPALPALLALLDVPVDDASWQALEPPAAPPATLDAVKRLILRESQVQPLLLVFEDLHWIDTRDAGASSTAWSRACPTARLLLLVNYRPEYQHGWGRKTLLPPAPPRPAAARERRASCCGRCSATTRASRRSKRLLIERTEGNPFFLEESVRTLVETEGARRRARAYRLVDPARTTSRCPPTVAGDAGGADRPAAARGQAAPPGGRGRRQGRALRACSRPSPSCRKTRSQRGLAQLQSGRVPVRDAPVSRTASTPSSTRSPTRLPTGASSGAAPALHAMLVVTLERLRGDR